VAITDEQDLNSLDEIRLLIDGKVKDLCTALHKPGGMITNPNAAAGQPAQIQDPGVRVSLWAETNLKMACYYLCHSDRVSHTLNAGSIMLESINLGLPSPLYF
jgi:hypothetical protein